MLIMLCSARRRAARQEAAAGISCSGCRYGGQGAKRAAAATAQAPQAGRCLVQRQHHEAVAPRWAAGSFGHSADMFSKLRVQTRLTSVGSDCIAPSALHMLHLWATVLYPSADLFLTW